MRQAGSMKARAFRIWNFEVFAQVCAFVEWASGHYTTTDFVAEKEFSQSMTCFAVRASCCFEMVMLTLFKVSFNFLSHLICASAAKRDCQMNILWL